jgi:hypothetical protein
LPFPWRLIVVRRRSRGALAERGRPAAGQAYVELALILPVLLLLALAVGDFGRVYATGIAVESAAREAADFAAFDDLTNSHFYEPVPGTVDAKDSTRTEALRRACTAVGSLPGFDDVAATCADPTAMCTDVAGSFCQLVVEDTRTSQPWASTCGTDPQTDVTCGWTVHVTVNFDFTTAINLAPLPSTVHFARESSYAISALPAGVPASSP